ncbi:MAG: peptidase M13 [Propionibacteriaceae bacterium]|nr:peptidase M13 [Propionibacteriaceae bacterium]
MTAFDLDPGVRPADDLFRHVNGRWLATAEIPADRSATGAFIQLRDAAEEAIRDIVTSLSDSQPGSEAAKVEQLYESFMDAERVEALGLEPLRPLLAEIDAISDVTELLQYFGRRIRAGIGAPLQLEVDSDPGDPTRYVLFAGQGGIGLPDEEYYRLEEHAPIREQYSRYIGKALTLAELAGDGAGILALETQVARRHWDKVRTRDMRAMYNPMSEGQWCSEGIDWSIVLRAAKVPPQASVVVAQPSFFTELGELITESRLEDWKSWARWRLISRLSPYLPQQLAQARFDFYGTVLQGTPQIRDRWKRGVELVEGLLGEAVGKLYVERHFPPAAKRRMDELVENLIRAYRQSISELEWMTDDTRVEALRKLDKFTPKIGYPSVWMDYSALQIIPDDLIGNVLRGGAFGFDDEISKLSGPIREYEWLMTPQTVNAYYHPLRNEIVFPAAILQPPFFDFAADDAENYGGIGAVIGHEIGHGFDDQGSTCDGDGRLRDWWTPADREAFEERTRALIGQYGELEPRQLPGLKVNGELTIGENIGDLGGLGIAHKAWRLTEAPSGERDGGEEYPPEQRFFFSWARCWQGKRRDEALRQQIATDPHSPEEFRCNQVVRNLDAFYEAFAVVESDAAWLPRSQRVRIW